MSRSINAKRFSKVMRALAKVPSQAARSIADDISREIQSSMDRSMDPYGKPWALRVNGQRTILKRTGAGRASIKVTPTVGAGFKITIGLLYMIYYQFGGKSHLKGHKKHKDFGKDKDRGGNRNHPVQRIFVPFDKLPDKWGAIALARIEGLAQKVINRG